MSSDERNKHPIAILTALPVECEAVCSYLVNISKETYRGAIYYKGIFEEKAVIVAQVGQGGVRTAAATTSMIEHYNPKIMLFIGVAGGRKDVRHGDVVVATKVYEYEAGKYEAGQENIHFQGRPEVWRPAYRLEEIAKEESKRADWIQRLKIKTPVSAPRIFLGPIAAGSAVIAADVSPTEQRLQTHFNDALAVEMEGHGFLAAVRQNDLQIEALVICGISDLLKDKAEADARNLQEIAAHHASAFAFELLMKQKIDKQIVQQRPDSHTSSTETRLSESEVQGKVSENSEDTIQNTAHLRSEYLLNVTDHRLKIQRESAYFDGHIVIHKDRCMQALKIVTRLQDWIEEGRAASYFSDVAMLMNVSLITGKIEEIKTDLSALRQACASGRQDQRYYDLCSKVHSKFTFLIELLERISRQNDLA